LRGGIDLSIGGMISLGTVIAATQFGEEPVSVAVWSLVILALGLSIGALNGLMISILKLQPFLVTLATWSILNGIAMLILPTDGGSVPGWWVGFGYAQFFGLSSPVWMLLLLLLFWTWFRATRLGITFKATDSVHLVSNIGRGFRAPNIFDLGVFGERPSDRLIPPAVGGPGGNIAYSDEPDLAAARRLAGQGAVRKATLYTCGDPVNKRIAEIVRSNLAEIGIKVRIVNSLGCLTGPETKKLAATDLQLISRFDVPDPAPFVEMALGNPYTVPGFSRDTRLRREIERARRTRGAARVRAYAKLDAVLVRDTVRFAVYASAVNPEFFSARVGCKVSQAALNFVDLGALCLRD